MAAICGKLDLDGQESRTVRTRRAMGKIQEVLSTDSSPTLEPLGQWGWLTRWHDEITAAAWAEIARSESWPCPLEVVAAYRSVATIPIGETTSAIQSEIRAAIQVSIDRFTHVDSSAIPPAQERPEIEVPVIYDGPDLPDVAESLGLTVEEVIALHTSVVYRVFAVGFLPGFPYAGYLPDAMSGLPRRKSPRARVAAGSVAIAGRQTGIYPCESPGGWHILGHTPAIVCDLERGFFRFRPADLIRFVPISPESRLNRD